LEQWAGLEFRMSCVKRIHDLKEHLTQDLCGRQTISLELVLRAIFHDENDRII